MLTSEEEAKMVRTNIEDRSGDPGTKVRAFVTKTKATHGRYPNAEEMTAFGKTLGIPCSIAPNLSGRAVGVAPVTRAAPLPPATSKAPTAARSLLSEYVEIMERTHNRSPTAEEVIAFSEAAGLVPRSKSVPTPTAPVAPTAAPKPAPVDRDAAFHAEVRRLRAAGVHNGTAQTQAFQTIYGDLYAK